MRLLGGSTIKFHNSGIVTTIFELYGVTNEDIGKRSQIKDFYEVTVLVVVSLMVIDSVQV